MESMRPRRAWLHVRASSSGAPARGVASLAASEKGLKGGPLAQLLSPPTDMLDSMRASPPGC
jgi:hypothetical protein